MNSTPAAEKAAVSDLGGTVPARGRLLEVERDRLTLLEEISDERTLPLRVFDPLGAIDPRQEPIAQSASVHLRMDLGEEFRRSGRRLDRATVTRISVRVEQTARW